MQSVKNLTRTVSVKKPTREFLSNQETHQSSPLNMCESQKYRYIHDLLDVLNNPTNFQLYRASTKNFR